MSAQLPPFFVMGCEGSGNNLLSLMLNSHSRMCVFLGSHYYQVFEPFSARYGDLGSPANARRLARDLLASLRARRLDVPLPVTRQVMAQLSEGTFEGVLTAFLRAYGRLQGTDHVGERTSRHFVYLERILDRFPDSPVILMMRDPRDIFYFVRGGLGMSCESMAADWNLAFQRYARTSRPVLLVRYERLVSDPEGVLAEVCEWLGESFEPCMLEFHRFTPEHFLRVPHHQRLASPVDASSIGVHSRLSDDERARIEAACSDGMKSLGYLPRTFRPPISAPSFIADVSLVRKVMEKVHYYGLDGYRWRMGVRRWTIVGRIELRYRLRRLVGLP